MKKTVGLRFISQHGIALMMVLWVLVLLSILSVSFLRETRWVSGSIRNFKEETQSYYMALSGYHEALDYILSDKDPGVDFLDSEGNFWLDAETQPVTGKKVTGEGEVEIRITDENAKININFSNDAMLRKLFEFAGVSGDEITVIIDSILDWKDLDREHHLSGAEDDYYEELPESYTAKNGLFDVPEELLLVKGMKPEYLYGKDGEQALLPLITTVGRSPLNINTVSREVMQLIGMNELEIETVLKQRSRDFGGFRFVPRAPSNFPGYGLRSVVTNNFRVEVTARRHNSPIASHITGIINRQHDTEGPRLKTIYWRERAETIRA